MASAPPLSKKLARDEAASKIGISGRTIESLKQVQADAPDLFEKVKPVEIPVPKREDEERDLRKLILRLTGRPNQAVRSVRSALGRRP